MESPDSFSPKMRVQSIDVLRGIIMVLMALDHSRDFFSNMHYDPMDFNYAGSFYFFTRWITHFCAPVFVFLSGTSAYLSMSRGKTKKQASWILFTRGIMLIIFEITIVRLGWTFNFDYSVIILQVIWAIGVSMVFLSALIFLPIPFIIAFGLIMIFGHDAFDSMKADSIAIPAMWNLIHQPGPVFLFSHSIRLLIIYPVIPWIGVMALGYCLGPVFRLPEKKMKARLLQTGIFSTILFLIIRGINRYGDPFPWQVQDTLFHTMLDFIKCQKYPPSLSYLLMTLGPSITILPLLQNARGKISGFFTVYGRVPLFYYVMHIFTIHAIALITGIIMGFPLDLFIKNGVLFNPNIVWGFSLGWVYLVWISVVLILYYPCRWYMRIKMKHKKWWLSYL